MGAADCPRGPAGSGRARHGGSWRRRREERGGRGASLLPAGGCAVPPSAGGRAGPAGPRLPTPPALALPLVGQARAPPLPWRAVVAEACSGSPRAWRDGQRPMAVGSVLAAPPAQAWWPAAGAGGRADALAQAAPWVVAGPGRWPPRRRPWRAGPPAQWGGRAAEGGPEGRAPGERLGLARTAPAPVPDATTGSRGPQRPAPGRAAPPGPCAPPGRGGSGGPAAREGAAREARAANPRRGRGPRARRPGHPAAWAPGG